MTRDVDPQEDELRAALRSLREDTPSNELARASLLSAVADVPTLYAVALEETAYPQAELDLHLEGVSVEDHATRADWLGHFIARFSSAVNEVTKSMTDKKRLTPGLQVLAPSPGSVRVVLRAPAPQRSMTDNVEGADDTTAESRALQLVTAVLKMSEDGEISAESPVTAATQALSPTARQRIRGVARSVMDASWQVEGTLAQRGRTLAKIHVDAGSAKRLYDELNRKVIKTSKETLEGTIDGQRHSLSAMWFIPKGSARAIEVAVNDPDLLAEVTQLSAIEDLEVECVFAVFLSVPAGSSQASSKSRELKRIRPVPRETLAISPEPKRELPGRVKGRKAPRHEGN